MAGLLGWCALKAALVLGVAVVSARLLRSEASAATRHLVLSAALLVALVLPLLALAGPRLGVSLPRAAFHAVVVEQVPSAAPGLLRVSGTAHAVRTRVAEPVAQLAAERSIPWTAILVALWSAVGLAFLVRASWGLRALSRIRGDATLLDAEDWQELLAELADALRIRRPVALLTSTAIEIPMTWGVLRPCVVLPSSAVEWPQDRRRTVLLHELAHVERFDALTQLVATIACALHWPNPLAWMAARAMRNERERACDDRVLHLGARGSDYAQTLLDVARLSRGRPQAALAMACRTQLEGRLLAVLDPAVERSPLRPRTAASAVVAAAFIAVPLAAVEAREPAPPRLALADGPKSADSAPRAPSAAGARVGSRTAHMSNTEDDHGNTTISWSDDNGDSATLNGAGKFESNADVTDLQLAPGATVDMVIRQGGHTRHVSLAADGSGRVRRTYLLDGHEEPWDARWFAGFLTEFDRHTGFAMDARFPALLRERGPSGVMDQVETLDSDYFKAAYLKKLLGAARLGDRELQRVLRIAGAIDSDYEKAGTLIEAAQHGALASSAGRAAFLAATQRIGSDYELGRTLRTVIETGKASRADVLTVLEGAQRIGSDYERAQLLVALTGRGLVDPDAVQSVLAVASHIGSDYEHARVLKTLDAQVDLDDRAVGLVLRQSTRIASDYERAALLTQIAARHPLQGTVRDAYEKAARSIASDYERGRALAALR